MATIRCINVYVADSAQFVAERVELRNCGGSRGRSFVAQLLELLRKATPHFCNGKAAVKEPWTPNAALTTKRSMRFGSSAREWPGVSFFFFCTAQKGVVCYVQRKTIRVWLLCWRVWRVDRRLKDVSLCSLSLHGSEGRSSKVLVADASSAPALSRRQRYDLDSARSADETVVEVVMLRSGATRALVSFYNAVGVKPSPFVTEDFVGKASVTTALTTVARRLTLCCDWREKRHFESALASVQGTGNRPCLVSDDQTVWIRWCRRWTQSTVTSQTDDDWCAVCGEDDGFACWQPNSLQLLYLAITYKLQYNVCTLVTLKSTHIAWGRLKQKFSWKV